MARAKKAAKTAAQNEPKPRAQGAPGDAAQAAAQESIDALEAVRADFEAQLKVANEKLLRARADYDNLGKRVAKESQDAVLRAKADVLLKVADVRDGLERAIVHLTDAGADIQGLRLVADEIDGMLESHGVKKIPADGNAFDVRLHTALERTETAEHAEGTILETYQEGWRLHDNVLRPAMVRVAVVPPAAPVPSEPTTDSKA